MYFRFAGRLVAPDGDKGQTGPIQPNADAGDLAATVNMEFMNTGTTF